MKEAVLWTLGIASMIVLGYMAAFSAQDMVWLLIPGLGLLVAIIGITKALK